MLQGSFPALITPMTQTGDVDYDAFKKIISFHKAEGSDGVIVCGTTGEAPTLTAEEKENLVKIAIDIAGEDMIIIVGTGSNDTATAIRQTKAAQSWGAHMALVNAPYYNKPNQAGIIAHFTAIHDASDLPIILYNVPGRTVTDMKPETVGALAKLERVVGLKDASAELDRVALHRLACGTDFSMLSGEDATAVGFNAMGGVGHMSVIGNIAPALCAEMQACCLDGNFGRALEIQDQLTPLISLLFADTSPGPVKHAAALMGLCGPHMRLPLLDIDEDVKKSVEKAVSDLGLIGACA